MEKFKTETGCMLFVQNLINLFLDEGHASEEPSDQSQTIDENSEMGSIEDKDSVGIIGNADFLKGCHRISFQNPYPYIRPKIRVSTASPIQNWAGKAAAAWCLCVRRKVIVKAMKNIFWIPIFLISLALLSAVDCASNGVGEWQILTNLNYSSQIRRHPHSLLFVTVPWCGESRSLMREVSRLVADKSTEFDSLKLMLIHRNTEKMLANSIGASDQITMFYYDHSLSYKYRGKLRARSILNSIHPYILAASPEELPLKPLNSQKDLTSFLESTDKALILAEFCAWAPNLLAKVKNNGTGTGTDSTPKEMDSGMLKCGVENGIAGIPWVTEFSTVNDSFSSLGSDNLKSGLGLSCTLKEYEQFDSFFSKLIDVRREFLVPPERLRFGLISHRSLMPSLGVEDSSTWMAVMYFKGCPGCSKVIKDEDDLKNALMTDNSVVRELQFDAQDLPLSLPANKPSVILFVDRSSETSETRRKSREALDAFRQVALHYQISDWMSSQNTDDQEKSSLLAYKGTTGHPRLQLSETAQKIRLKDKTSFMIINEGKHVTLDNIASDLQGKSFQEILASLLERKKEAKLSSLAKELGFRLLSDDLDIKTAHEVPSQTDDQSNDASQPPSQEVPLIGIVDPQSLPMETENTLVREEKPKSIGVEVGPSSPYKEDGEVSPDKSKHFISIETDKLLEGLELVIAEDFKAKEKLSLEIEKSGEQEPQVQEFKGSFLLCDDNYRLLESLTGGSTIPSLVLVDPRSRHHYFHSEETILSYLSISKFLQEYLSGSLVPYQRSVPVLHSPRESTSPPFVNLDFHETDSIPRVTMGTLSKLVFGSNQSNSVNAAHARSEDIVVLFSSNWCGFCQRMELVVREAYRAIRGYMKMFKTASGKEQAPYDADNSMNNTKLPLIYLMDCTLNDCSLILKSANQREVYPALMLFPAETETVISYNGDMSVANIIKFIAHHGSNSHHLYSEKGILLTTTEGAWKNQDSPRVAGHEEGQTAKDKFHEVILKNQNPKRVAKYNGGKSSSYVSVVSNKATFEVVVGSILTATDKLLEVIPFDNSKIIIVKADEETGFQGLIFNKPIRWDALDRLEEGLEFLKEAPLYFGGPVLRRGMPLVALTRTVNETGYVEVSPGIYFLDQFATVANIEKLKAGNQSINDYWFFFGYTGWGWQQLFQEIGEGGWTVSNGDNSLDWPLN
ncbi:hypothetical protein V6N11_072365 [Hibiscus sabdariffa]|uniref:Thioredoxin domain-containing protein n=1 Tax=Hibiscus sabdariffa TaxID=183260 RepID=A0ABR2U2T6_9ROSI